MHRGSVSRSTWDREGQLHTQQKMCRGYVSRSFWESAGRSSPCTQTTLTRAVVLRHEDSPQPDAFALHWPLAVASALQHPAGLHNPFPGLTGDCSSNKPHLPASAACGALQAASQATSAVPQEVRQAASPAAPCSPKRRCRLPHQQHLQSPRGTSLVLSVTAIIC